MANPPLQTVVPSTAPLVERSPPDLVTRATAILSRQTQKLPQNLPDALPRMSGPTGALGTRASPADTVADIQRRGMSVLADLFAVLATLPGTDSVGRTPADAASSNIPWHCPARPVSPGATAAIPLRLENLENRPVGVAFFASDLLSDNGASIPSYAVSFNPTTLNVGSNEQAVVTATIDVPPQTIRGAYSGLVQAAGLALVKSVITVEVD